MARSRNAAGLLVFVGLFAFCAGVFVTELRHGHGPVQVILMTLALVYGILALIPLGWHFGLKWLFKHARGGWF